MGGAPVINYNEPITQKPQGESAIYRFPDYKDRLWDKIDQKSSTMKDILINSAKKYANNPAIGKIVKNENDTKIEFFNYKTSIELAQQIGSAIIGQGLYNTPEGQKMKMFGIFSKNRPQWSLLDISACLFGMTTIPIYDTLGDQNITYVFQHTQLTTCFVNDGALKALVKCKNLVKISTLVSCDPISQDMIGFFKERGVNLILFKDLLNAGKEKLLDYNSQDYRVSPQDCLTFSYTSGTTGPPKGAMISHRNFASFVTAITLHKDTRFNQNDIGLSYLPLPHILERQFIYSMFASGARVVFFSGDIQKLKDDLAIVKPTIFVSVPRLYSRFYDVLNAKFKQLTGFTKTALEYALNTKLQNLKSTGTYTHSVYDRFFFAKTRQALGGNVRLMISGSAPLLPQVQNFLKVCMCAPLLQGYGQTQSTGAMLVTDANDPQVRHVGGPTSNFEIKLVDIPQMNYLSTDKDEKGNPTPRGQIWCRGPGVFMGYYHDQVKTRQAINKDGWLLTGDVGAMSAKTRAISIVDRKKNIFKLQQGQYVAAQKVQNVYLKGDRFAEIFIHGQSTQTFVLAIAVPHKKVLEELAAAKGIQGSFEELCKNDVIRADCVTYLNNIGKQAGLTGFEQAKNIYLQSQPFMNKGILTNTMKIQRHQAKKFYKPIVDQLYKEGMLKA